MRGTVRRSGVLITPDSVVGLMERERTPGKAKTGQKDMGKTEDGLEGWEEGNERGSRGREKGKRGKGRTP